MLVVIFLQTGNPTTAGKVARLDEGQENQIFQQKKKDSMATKKKKKKHTQKLYFAENQCSQQNNTSM